MEKKECVELLAIYFEESGEIRPAHLLYKDLQTVRPDINKFEFCVVAQIARDGYDGKASNGDLGWSLSLRPPNNSLQDDQATPDA